MKKIIFFIVVAVALLVGLDYAYYRLGWYIDLHPDRPITAFVEADGDRIYMTCNGERKEFTVKGVDLGSGKPGASPADFAIDKETYLRWFGQIQSMGANTLRVYTVQQDTFYDAFYEYNKGRQEPLWLLHSVGVSDDIQNSHRGAYDENFLSTFLSDCRTVVDVVHGNKKLSPGQISNAGYGSYRKDISRWVIGYILGADWESDTVIYTDENCKGLEDCSSYAGKYMYTSPEATPFEAMLAQVGDKMIEYESERYKQQRLIAFSNRSATDPFVYPERVSDLFMKCATIDVEHIKTTKSFIAGQFASYHVYPFYPDYLAFMDDWSAYGLNISDYSLPDDKLNTYRAYLQMLTDHHTMPVVISEFGVSTGRGAPQRYQNTGRDRVNMSETEQGQALADCWQDLQASGCNGGCVFSWQDDWSRGSLNTAYAVDLTRAPYWSDYQTSTQYFGLLSFDPGAENSVCYVDGDVSEWSPEDLVIDSNGISLSAKYDERFMYFMIHKADLDFEHETLYIPIDTTQKSGSSYCENHELTFDRAADFLLVINGKSNSRITVQERYESLRSTYSIQVSHFDTYLKENQPAVDSPKFVNINMILQTAAPLISSGSNAKAEVFETGLLTYGNANPDSPHFNSLADFICRQGYIELRLPWQLLNFADPSGMKIHDDYYDGNYGVKYQTIDRLYVGVSTEASVGRIHMETLKLNGWGERVTYHERLKPSYYILQKLWTAPGAQ